MQQGVGFSLPIACLANRSSVSVWVFVTEHCLRCSFRVSNTPLQKLKNA
jgi:hypothetical protein